MYEFQCGFYNYYTFDCIYEAIKEALKRFSNRLDGRIGIYSIETSEMICYVKAGHAYYPNGRQISLEKLI